jgi:hypothetical protein
VTCSHFAAQKQDEILSRSAFIGCIDRQPYRPKKEMVNPFEYKLRSVQSWRSEYALLEYAMSP